MTVLDSAMADSEWLIPSMRGYGGSHAINDLIFFKAFPVTYILSGKAIEIISRLNSFITLPENWDSYGAVPPKRTTIDKAISIVRKADENDLPLYFTAPGPNGELVLEFRNGNKEAAAYLNPDGSTELVLNEGDKILLEGTLEDNYKDLLKFINF